MNVDDRGTVEQARIDSIDPDAASSAWPPELRVAVDNLNRLTWMCQLAGHSSEGECFAGCGVCSILAVNRRHLDRLRDRS